MTFDDNGFADPTSSRSTLTGPRRIPSFVEALDEMVGLARRGHRKDSEYFNPSDQWIKGRLRIFQDLSEDEQNEIRAEAELIARDAAEANAQGKAAARAAPEVVYRLDSGGLAFYSQLGVVRRPDLTQYFIDGFDANRDSIAFSDENQTLFAEVFSYVTEHMKKSFESGDVIVQSDRNVCDVPERSYHARQLLFGTRYLQIPIMWRQLTFDMPVEDLAGSPDILEISIPDWLDDLGLPEALKRRVVDAGLTQLIFKAPTKGLSLHLGFDYVGEHKMGPLSIAMFLVKQKNGLAVQSALSMSRAKTLDGRTLNTAMVTIGPSLHGKSTLTIMIELAGSELAQLLGLQEDPAEGVYPMNDDIVLLQPLDEPIEVTRGGNSIRITHGIDGTENNFYAMPQGLNQQDDPITYEAIRGTAEAPNAEETLENVPLNVEKGIPDFIDNPVRNMRVTMSRNRLISRKKAQHVIEAITEGRLSSSVHVPMEYTDRVFWQAVMRENTVIPPLRRLSLEQYVRVLMYGEAVQMGAATGAIGRPYVEYFSDPFIIGLEDENANLLYFILQQMSWGGMPQDYFVFNTGGVGADVNDEASGPRYKKITKELTLMLQEALIRDAVKFEYDSALRSEIGVAIVNDRGEEVVDLRGDWLPKNIYGEADYARRTTDLRRRRYYGRDAADKAGILRYTKVTEGLIDLADVPSPCDERELSWLLSFFWKVDRAYDSLPELVKHLSEGRRPLPHLVRGLQQMYDSGAGNGLLLSADRNDALNTLGIRQA